MYGLIFLAGFLHSCSKETDMKLQEDESRNVVGSAVWADGVRGSCEAACCACSAGKIFDAKTGEIQYEQRCYARLLPSSLIRL